jgi:hypothetical protein
VLPNACSSRIAISGEIPAWPLSSAGNPLGVTPRPFAASVTDRPSGSRHSSLMTSPGCGGLCQQFRTLAEPWADPGTSTEHLMLAAFESFADVERDLTHTLTVERRSRAKVQGKHMGPPF